MFPCCSWGVCLVWLVLLYKILDRLIRYPKRSSPTSRVNNILITGCDTGFGRIFALRMASKGFKVFASCLTSKGKEELEQSSTLIKPFLMDVRDNASIKNAYEEVKGSLSQGQGLWALVNNAGVPNTMTGPVEWLTRDDYLNTCSVNLFGLIEVTRVFLPLLKPTQGRIVNTSSIVGRIGFAGSAPYCVSKYGVEGFSDCLRYEMVTWGISVHLVEPGFHQTYLSNPGVINASTRAAWDRLSDELKEEYGEDFLQKSQELVDNTIPKLSSSRLDDVVDSYEHATLGYFPRGRYMPGNDARFVFWPLSLAPEWLSTLFMSREAGKAKPKSLTKPR